MKKRNLYHFFECIVLSSLFFFFAFFIKMRSDLFFTFTLIFSAIPALAQIVYLYIVGDSEKEHPCHLLPLDASDVLFLYYLLQTACATVFLVIHHFSDFSPWTAFAIYLILLLLTALLLFFPELKEPEPTPDNELDEVSDKRLRYYANYLGKLCRKCQYAPLGTVMTEVAELLPRIDPSFSVQLQILENDLSSKCVKIENALLTGEHTKLPLLTREMEASLAYIQKRLHDYHYILTDEGFCPTDDEIANTQIDSLLDKLGLEYEEDLPTLDAPFTEEFFYRKALLFATDEYKILLADYNQQIIDRIAAEERAKADRRNHGLRHLRRCSHIAALGLIAAVIALPLYWHFGLEPYGLITTEDEQGNLTVTGYNSFYGDELVIPAEIHGKKVISVGRDSLKDCDLTSLTLEEGIERLEYQAIRDNLELTYLSLPSTLKEIGNFTFYKLDALHTVYYAGSQEEWEAIQIGSNGNWALEKATIECAK